MSIHLTNERLVPVKVRFIGRSASKFEIINVRMVHTILLTSFDPNADRRYIKALGRNVEVSFLDPAAKALRQPIQHEIPDSELGKVSYCPILTAEDDIDSDDDM